MCCSCQPTGSGVCNLAFYERYYPDAPSGSPDRRRTEVFIYNKFCREIGSKKPIETTKWVNIYSELPYVVVIAFDVGVFKYAGYEYWQIPIASVTPIITVPPFPQ
jgi:hypothetical protein